jgi:hypothetical protein
MTKTTSSVSALLCSSVVTLAGLGAAPAADNTEATAKKIIAALAKLSDADRPAAEAQRWCAVTEDSRLGSMGTPVKVTISGKTVFVCCAGCKAKAAKNGPATLAKAAESKKVNSAMAKLSVEDRKAAEAQRLCAVMEESRLGTMGAPVKVMVEGQPIFLCCKGCTKRALADPKATLAKVSELKKAGDGSE